MLDHSCPPRSLVLVAVSAGELRTRIVDGLPRQGWSVISAAGGDELAGLIAAHSPDFLLLDHEMAARSAGSFRAPGLPCVALVPAGDSEIALNMLRTLSVNACVSLPLRVDLLAAQLDGMRRLLNPAAGEAPLARPRAGEDAGTWSISRTTWNLSAPGGESLHLTRTEATFLSTLAASPGAPVSRTQMIAALGHNADYYDSRRLDTLVSRLRQKASRENIPALPIRSIHAVGYAFAAAIVVDA